MKKLFRRIRFCFFLCLILWLSGLLWFIDQIPTAQSNDTTPADAIVVLTGGSNRLEYGLQLLAHGLGRQLFITGVHDNITVETLLLHNATPQIQQILLPVADRSIILGHEAENTIGNADETKRWLNSMHYTSIRLVTSNYHMPRSLEEFNDTVKGVKIIPSPVEPDDFTMANWWCTRESRNLILSEYHKYMAAVARHWLVSQLRRT